MELTFSTEFTGVMTAMLLACIILPVMYYIFYAFRRKINHAVLLAGLASFLVFGYFLSGFLLGSFAPQSKSEAMSPLLHALIRAVCVGVAEGGGMYLALRFLSAKYQELKTPISFGLGYSLINMIIVGGANAALRLSQALSVNSIGLQAVLDTVDETQRAALTDELLKMSETAFDTYLFTVGEYIGFFMICVGISRLLWYSIKGERREPSWVFIPLALFLRIAADFPVAFYHANGTDNYVLIECLYYGICILILGASMLASRFWSNREVVRAAPVDRYSL